MIKVMNKYTIFILFMGFLITLSCISNIVDNKEITFSQYDFIGYHYNDCSEETKEYIIECFTNDDIITVKEFSIIKKKIEEDSIKNIKESCINGSKH